MGWRGTVRSLNAIARDMERESRRRQRELERERKEYEKMAALEQAKFEVDEFENYLDRITSLHKDVSSRIDWNAILAESAPREPVLGNELLTKAEAQLLFYKPSFFRKTFGSVEDKLEQLKQSVEDARQQEQKIYEQSVKEYENEINDHKEAIDVAQGVLNGDYEIYKKALEDLQPFSEIGELGSNIRVSFDTDKPISALLNVHGEDIIPEEAKSLLSSGKLSIKNMAKGRFYELYQDYVCGCVLRVANEILAVLPVEHVLITAVDNILNTQTGHVEELPILSVFIPRDTISKMNMEAIDPSDSMKSFIHNMDFKKTKGFSSVEVVNTP